MTRTAELKPDPTQLQTVEVKLVKFSDSGVKKGSKGPHRFETQQKQTGTEREREQIYRANEGQVTLMRAGQPIREEESRGFFFFQNKTGNKERRLSSLTT